MSEEPPLVLVVEDEPDLADLYAAWLDDEYRVRTAYDGREAIESLHDRIDVILLDRRMPGLSGDEVLETVRDEGIDCRVAMVTAVEPDFDIIAMGFDDYLVKPVTREALRQTARSLVTRSKYDSNVQELYSLASKKAVLGSQKDRATLEDNEEFRELSDRLDDLKGRLDETVAELGDHEEFELLFRGIDRDAGDLDFPSEN